LILKTFRAAGTNALICNERGTHVEERELKVERE
jgi:hypothetical protein